MAENSQEKVFISAKDSVAKDLSVDMLGWDFQMMLVKLREEIERNKPPGRNNRKVRFFSRHFLKMGGERYNQVRQWLNEGRAMSESDIRIVLTTLSQLEKGTFQKSTPPAVPASTRDRRIQSASANVAIGAGARRKIVDLMIGTLNNFVGVIAEMKLTPEEVLDGDRMQIVSALQNICPAMGISIKLSRLDEDNSMPVKPSEMQQLLKGNKNE